MDRFPTLKTGAQAQYPAERRLAYATEAHRFLDSSEQRYVDHETPKRSWRLELDQLSPAENAAIREFFDRMRGVQTDFEFVDPWTGQVVAPCRFGHDELEDRLSRESSESTAVTIREL
jgi:hypothetical protein